MLKKKILLLLVLLAAAVGGIFIFYGFPNLLKGMHLRGRKQVYPKPPKVNDTGYTKQGVAAVVAANNTFAFKLYHSSRLQRSQNLLYSPYSISSALAIVYEGANSQTLREIKQVFQFPDKTLLRPNFARIYNAFNHEVKKCTLKTANALWIQQNYPIRKQYKDTVSQYYGAQAENLDFMGQTEQARQTINRFIAEQTAGKIHDLIVKLSPFSRLVITNAVYFQGFWKWRFKKENTSYEKFYITPQHAVEVPLMYMQPKGSPYYTETPKLQILELPYKGNRIVMLILLPKQGRKQSFQSNSISSKPSEIDESKDVKSQLHAHRRYQKRLNRTFNYTLKDVEPELTYENLTKWKAQMCQVAVDAVYLPRFKFSVTLYLKDTLMELGMPTPFQDADFTDIVSANSLFISQVIHKAYIDVNEKGTEAAAATVVDTSEKCIIERPIFRVDHPFIFIIEDKVTGTILFWGRVVNPLQQKYQYP